MNRSLKERTNIIFVNRWLTIRKRGGGLWGSCKSWLATSAVFKCGLWRSVQQTLCLVAPNEMNKDVKIDYLLYFLIYRSHRLARSQKSYIVDPSTPCLCLVLYGWRWLDVVENSWEGSLASEINNFVQQSTLWCVGNKIHSCKHPMTPITFASHVMPKR